MRAAIERSFLGVLACSLPCVALAQPLHWPSPQQIDQALKASPFPSAERIGSEPRQLPPRVQPGRAVIDIEALAKQGLQLPNASGAPSSPHVPLRIFVTLDMPRASLELLADQASRTGAVLVLRGLKSQSMRETVRTVADVIGNRKVAWVIDPEAFVRFGVQSAPTFVLALDDGDEQDAERGCGAGCPTRAAFASVAGDVSLDYALEAILRRRPEAARRAEPILKRLHAS